MKEERKKLEIIKTVTDNTLAGGLLLYIITGIISFSVGGILGGSAVHVYEFTNYVAIDSINTLIKNIFVDTELVKETILELDSPKEQLDMIAKTLEDKNSDLDNNMSIMKNILVKLCENEKVSTDVSQEELEHKLEEKIGVLLDAKEAYKAEIDSLNNRIKEREEENIKLKEEKSELEKEKRELENRTTADIKSAALIVSGERVEENNPNSIAVIKGNTYYAESFLNTFLEDKLLYSLEESTVAYGVTLPEKVLLASSMTHDSKYFDFHSVGSGKIFMMETEEYNKGIVSSGYDESVVYISCKGQYSAISFTIGHIDGSGMGNKTLIIYTMNEEGKYNQIETISLTGEMRTEEKLIQIGYSDSVKIVITGGNNTRYGLADIYLYS